MEKFWKIFCIISDEFVVDDHVYFDDLWKEKFTKVEWLNHDYNTSLFFFKNKFVVGKKSMFPHMGIWLKIAWKSKSGPKVP